MKWHAHAIGEVAQVNPKLGTADRPSLNDKVSFVPMASVSEETMSIAVHEERPFFEVAKGYTPFRRGDVLVAKITPCFENGKMALADDLPHELGFGTTEFHVFRPSERVTGQYLFNILRVPWLRSAGATKMRGAAGQRRVPADFFASVQIPLPPLAEQERIAGILDAVDALRAKRREALVQFDTLLQSTFLDMFGDPIANPMGWPEVALGAHTSKIGSGATPLGGEAAYMKDGIALIRSMNVRDGHFSQHGLAFIDDQQAARLDGVVVEPDDVLLNITGASVARVCRAPHDILPARVNQHVAIIRPTNGFDQRFLEQCLLFPSMKHRLLRIAGSGATREAITKDAIMRLIVVQPPRNEQNRFAAIVESVERQKASQRAHLAELDTLFASLQSRAFQGDL